MEHCTSVAIDSALSLNAASCSNCSESLPYWSKASWDATERERESEKEREREGEREGERERERERESEKEREREGGGRGGRERRMRICVCNGTNHHCLFLSVDAHMRASLLLTLPNQAYLNTEVQTVTLYYINNVCMMRKRVISQLNPPTIHTLEYTHSTDMYTACLPYTAVLQPTDS